MLRNIKFILFVIILTLFACERTNKKPEKVIVSVGEGYLSLERVKADIPASIRNKITQENVNNYIQQWIENELIYRDALNKEMDKDPELDYALEKAKKHFLVSKYLEAYLKEDNLALETEAVQYYEENKDSYVLAEDRVKALHILVENYQDARDARRRVVNNGEDFETVAKEVSLDFFDKKRIVLDYFSQDEIIPEISSWAFRKRVGSVSGPIKSDFGYHIVKIIDKRKKGGEIEFEEVKDEIISRIRLMKKTEKYRDLIIELRNKINIRKDEELLQQLFVDSLYVKEIKKDEVKE